LCREQGGETDRTVADNRHDVPRFHLPVQYPAFQTGGKNATEHDNRFVIGIRRQQVQTVIGKRDSDVFGLSAVDTVAQPPAAIEAMGIHSFPAEAAPATGGNKRDEHFVPFVETQYVRSHLLDDPTPSWPRIRPSFD